MATRGTQLFSLLVCHNNGNRRRGRHLRYNTMGGKMAVLDERYLLRPEHIVVLTGFRDLHAEVHHMAGNLDSDDRRSKQQSILGHGANGIRYPV